jgi:hypothetical protein
MASRAAQEITEEFAGVVGSGTSGTDSENDSDSKPSRKKLRHATKAEKVEADDAGIAGRRANDNERNKKLFRDVRLGAAVNARTSSTSKEGGCSTRGTSSPASKRAPGHGSNTRNTDREPHCETFPTLQFSSPTRGSVHRQKNDILLVFGGPIHCTDPINADTCYLLLPISSKGITSLLFWPGNQTSY